MISRNSVHWENHHLEVKFHARLAICLTSTALTPPKDSDKSSKSRLVITETRSLPGSPCSCRVGKTTLQRLGMKGIAFYRRTSAVSTSVKYARDTPFSTVKVAAYTRFTRSTAALNFALRFAVTPLLLLRDLSSFRYSRVKFFWLFPLLHVKLWVRMGFRMLMMSQLLHCFKGSTYLLIWTVTSNQQILTPRQSSIHGS